MYSVHQFTNLDSHLQSFPELFNTWTAVYQFITQWSHDYQVCVVNRYFFLSDSDEDPLPPKVRYYASLHNKFLHQCLSMHMLLALYMYSFWRGYCIGHVYLSCMHTLFSLGLLQDWYTVAWLGSAAVTGSHTIFRLKLTGVHSAS